MRISVMHRRRRRATVVCNGGWLASGRDRKPPSGAAGCWFAAEAKDRGVPKRGKFEGVYRSCASGPRGWVTSIDTVLPELRIPHAAAPPGVPRASSAVERPVQGSRRGRSALVLQAGVWRCV